MQSGERECWTVRKMPSQLANDTTSTPIARAVFNFTNSIIGAGIIGIPFALQQCGFFIGIVCLVSVAFLVYQSVMMMVECGLIANTLDLEALCLHLLGLNGFYLALTFMFMFAYGAQIAYMVIVGDTIPAVAAHMISASSIFANRTVVMATLSTLIILPLCLLKDLSTLSWTSLISISFDIILVCIAMANAPAAAQAQDIEFASGIWAANGSIALANPTLFAGIGAMSFAFVCQHNSFIVFRTLQHRTLHNWSRVAKRSIGFSLSLCLSFGLCGFLSFGNAVRGDFLNNFPISNVPIGVSRSLLAMCMVFTFPLECFVARHCLVTILSKYRSTATGTGTVRNRDLGREESSSYLIANMSHIDELVTRASNSNSRGTSSCDSKSVNYPSPPPGHRPELEPHQELELAFTSQIQSPDQLCSSPLHPVSSALPLPSSPRSWRQSRKASLGPLFGHKHSFSRLSTEESPLRSVGIMNNDNDSNIENSVTTITDRFNIKSHDNINDEENDDHQDDDEVSVVFSHIHDNANTIDNLAGEPAALVSDLEMNLMTLALWGSSTFIAIVCKDLGIVLTLTGTLTGSILGYVLPAVLYINTHKAAFDNAVKLAGLRRHKASLLSHATSSPLKSTPAQLSVWDKVSNFRPFFFSFFMIFFGCVVLVIGVCTVLYHAATDKASLQQPV